MCLVSRFFLHLFRSLDLQYYFLKYQNLKIKKIETNIQIEDKIRIFFQSGRKVDDLFVDLRDGYSLIALLEVLTGERIVRFFILKKNLKFKFSAQRERLHALSPDTKCAILSGLSQE